MKPDELIGRLRAGKVRNVSFADFVSLIRALGFKEGRRRGSHHIFTHPKVTEFMNVQSVKGQIKPYHARQLLTIIDEYNLTIEAKNE